MLTIEYLLKSPNRGRKEDKISKADIGEMSKGIGRTEFPISISAEIKGLLRLTLPNVKDTNFHERMTWQS